jgi:hypothetical protein
MILFLRFISLLYVVLIHMYVIGVTFTNLKFYGPSVNLRMQSSSGT